MYMGKNIEDLFEYAVRCEFEDFNALFKVMELELPEKKMAEAYLMRGQIKLITTDLTAVGDLKKGAELIERPHYPCLDSLWHADSANRFIVFPRGKGVLVSFLMLLPEAKEKMIRLYGEAGNALVRRIRYEIYYYIGAAGAVIDYVESHPNIMLSNNSNIDRMYMLSLCFRSYLSMGENEKAEQSMLGMIKMSQKYPECLQIYQEVRGWANVTTGWSGDTPRFYRDSNGHMQSVLNDRVEAVRRGIGKGRQLESCFVGFAQSAYENTYTIRQYYMDIFHAMYWLSVGDCRQAEYYFIRLYEIAEASGVIMPFVECGEQILPLLQYMRDSEVDCPSEWISKIISMASRYEESLNSYRTLNL